MAQLRHDYEQFKATNTEILVLVPNGPRMIARYVSTNQPLYPILSDRGSKVARDFKQVKQFFNLGTPSVFVVDQSQKIRYVFYGTSIADEPGNEAPLAILRQLNNH